MGKKGCDVSAESIESGGEFDPSLLSAENIMEKGEMSTFIEGAQYVRIPGFEGMNMSVPLGYVQPNPRQPRKYFNSVKM